MKEDVIENIDKEIKYYDNYKTQLNQFIIYNCAYIKPSKLQDRIRLDTGELLSVLKEISRIQKIIYDLNSLKKENKSMSYHIYNKSIN